jgi:HAD superfamily 5'-nucleotidase-like hydrolase
MQASRYHLLFSEIARMTHPKLIDALSPDAGASVPPPHDSQLVLPHEDFVGPAAPVAPLAREARVFCNRHLKMAQISWIGFDMDYTLAIYNQAEMDALSIRATAEKLVGRGYPSFVREINHATDYPVRGLLIDKKFGHVLKMDRYKYVGKGYHGFRELSKTELRDLYHAKKIRPATARFHWIDTLYALSEVALYSALVDAHERHGLAVDYGKLFDDIRECIDEAHRDGTILDAIMADLPRYVMRDPDLAQTLHKWRSAGKRLFLLTNSRWAYSDKMMTYLLGGAMAEYPSWRNYFDVVICAARKPSFFQDRNPLVERNVEKDTTRVAKLPLERGKVYEGGNIEDLDRALGVPGDEVLYVGDHIYGDILRSKKDSAWRTALIMQELDTEIRAHEACVPDIEYAERLHEMHDRLENDLRFYQSRFKEIQREMEALPDVPPELAAERTRMKRAVDRVRERLRAVDQEEDVVARRTDARFHRYWGSIMKEGAEQSSFGKQVEDYACVYTSRVSNFRSYSPQQTFRSPRDEMAHELG